MRGIAPQRLCGVFQQVTFYAARNQPTVGARGVRVRVPLRHERTVGMLGEVTMAGWPWPAIRFRIHVGLVLVGLL